MLDIGYLYANDENRLFINTCLGCIGECSYCYLSQIGYSNKKKLTKIMSAEEIIAFLEEANYNLSMNTLITFGCFSECWDETNKPETIKLIKYFLSKGNQVQLSTKKQIYREEISDILPLIKYYGQFIVFVSSSTISMHDTIEKNTEKIENRFKTFELTKQNIPVVLYIKPVLKNITFKDIHLYKMYIEKYKIDNVVVGSIFTNELSNETVHFSNKNELFYNPISDEKLIVNELDKICRVFLRSTDVTNFFKNSI